MRFLPSLGSIGEFDSKIDDLKVKAQKAAPKAKSDFSAAMAGVDAKRAAIVSDLQSARDLSAQGIDSLRAKVDHDLGEFKKAIDVAGKAL